MSPNVGGTKGYSIWGCHRNKSVIVIISLFTVLVLFYYIHLISGYTNSLNLFVTSTAKPKYQWRREYSELNGPDISPISKSVLAKLGEKHIRKVDKSVEYNLTNMTLDYDPSMGQSQVIRKFFNNLKNGFFVECGALDGELRSNTLYLERVLGWDGLLIEADPDNYKELMGKNRKSWTSNSCLSTKPYPTMVSFEQRVNQGKISGFTAGYMSAGFVDVQCYPLETYLTYLNRTKIDYFSLDVEGLELEILKTIDYEKYEISSLSVEFIHDVEGKVAIEEFMKTKGYFVLTEVTHPNWLANDFIFIKNNLKKQ